MKKFNFFLDIDLCSIDKIYESLDKNTLDFICFVRYNKK